MTDHLDPCTPPDEIKALHSRIERLEAAFRVNLLRLDPTLSHASIDKLLKELSDV